MYVVLSYLYVFYLFSHIWYFFAVVDEAIFFLLLLGIQVDSSHLPDINNVAINIHVRFSFLLVLFACGIEASFTIMVWLPASVSPSFVLVIN